MSLTALLGCGSDPLSKLVPKIAVEPTTLDFGDGIVGTANPGTLKVEDIGTGVLMVSGATIDPAGSVFAVMSLPGPIPPSGSGPLVVTFEPAHAHEVDQATLVISSNDPHTPQLRVPLKGTGGVQKIQVDPSMVDFGLVDEGTSPRRTVTISNIGKDVLVVSAVSFTSTSSELSLAPGFQRGSLLPGTSTSVTLIYSPSDPGIDTGILEVDSNDETTPMVKVPVRGQANLAPRAIAWGCPVTTVGQVGCSTASESRRLSASVGLDVELDGRQSYDPQGQPLLEYRWELLSLPPGSMAVIFHSTADRTQRMNATGDIQVDLVGEYDLRLIVKDARGLESLDLPESHVQITPKDLEFLLQWDIATNVDLHVVRPGGRLGDYGSGIAGTSTGSDCSTYNRAPIWGGVLDIDDVVGRGPVIVGLDHPEDHGVPYRAYAHYCDGHNIGVPVDVTLQIFVRGMLIQTIPDMTHMVRLHSGDAIEMAEVTWNRTSSTVRNILDTSTGTPTSAPWLCRIH
jgi:hypothetical protein